jgi:hypothetical protein
MWYGVVEMYGRFRGTRYCRVIAKISSVRSSKTSISLCQIISASHHRTWWGSQSRSTETYILHTWGNFFQISAIRTCWNRFWLTLLQSISSRFHPVCGLTSSSLASIMCWSNLTGPTESTVRYDEPFGATHATKSCADSMEHLRNTKQASHYSTGTWNVSGTQNKRHNILLEHIHPVLYKSVNRRLGAKFRLHLQGRKISWIRNLQVAASPTG